MKSQKGETLVEALAAILVFTQSSLLLFTAVTASNNMNRDARALEQRTQSALLAAEQALPEAANGTAQITLSLGSDPIDRITVDIFGGQDGTPFRYFQAGGDAP